MTGPQFWGREVSVKIGPYGGTGIEWSGVSPSVGTPDGGFRIDFDIEKVDVSGFTQGKAAIYGVNKTSIDFIQKFALLPQDPSGSPFLIPGQLIISAGYTSHGGALPIFIGHIQPFTGVSLKRSGGQVIIEVSAVDSGGNFAQSNLAISMNGPTTSTQLLVLLAAKIGLPLGPQSEALPVVSFPRGFTHGGPTRLAMDRVCKAINASWFIRDGLIVVTEKGKSTQETAPLLTPQTGLIGSPERIEGGRKVRFKALLNPGIAVRRQVMVKAADVDGAYIMQRVRHYGSNYIDDFTTEGEGFSSRWGYFYGAGGALQ